MALLASGNSANIVLESNESLRVTTGGSAKIEPQYGAPAGDTTVTAATQTFGPYGVPAKLILRALLGSADYLVVEDATSTGAGLSVDNIDGLTSADGSLEIVVPGTQAGTPRVLRKATVRPVIAAASWPAVLSLTGMQNNDTVVCPPSVFGTRSAVTLMYDGTRWLPTGPMEYLLAGLRSAPPTTARTTVGSFVLASDGLTTNFFTWPANFLRLNSRFECLWRVYRTGADTTTITPRLAFGRNPTYGNTPYTVAADSMSGTSPGMLRELADWSIVGPNRLMYSNAAGFGSNQASDTEGADDATQIDLTQAMSLGCYLNAIAASNASAALQYLFLRVTV